MSSEGQTEAVLNSAVSENVDHVSEANNKPSENVTEVNSKEEPSPKKAKLAETTKENADSKPTRTKRKSNFTEKVAAEAEDFIKDIKDDDISSNKRRTRSQTRGVPAPAPVEKASKARQNKEKTKEPKEKPEKNSSEKSPARRGRGRPPKAKVDHEDDKVEAKKEESKGAEEHKNNAENAVVANNSEVEKEPEKVQTDNAKETKSPDNSVTPAVTTPVKVTTNSDSHEEKVKEKLNDNSVSKEDAKEASAPSQEPSAAVESN